MPPWNSVKAKVQLRISVQRLRILQQKKEAQAKATRREIATLLERGKIETARVKVESIISEDIHVELLELLELYSELLLARFGMLDQNTREPDPGVREGVCSIIYAAPRTELKELHVLRDILMHKYGREFSVSVMENRDGCVSDRVTRKLVIATPSPELVNGYLTEIAKAYGVEWTPPTVINNSDSSEEGVKQLTIEAKEGSVLTPTTDAKTESPAGSPKLPEYSPPTEREDQVNKDVSLKTAAKPATAIRSLKPVREDEGDDFEALTKRFAALKKR